MTPLAIEWIEKAEGDYATALRELRARNRPNYDSACFHSQQCVEKYLKARLQEEAIAFPRTHNLIELLNLILPVQPEWATLHPSLLILTNYAISYRYPGDTADRDEAKDAVSLCRGVRALIRGFFDLPV